MMMKAVLLLAIVVSVVRATSNGSPYGSTSGQFGYQVNNATTNACPSSSTTPISSAVDCIAAATALDCTYRGSWINGRYPRGCYSMTVYTGSWNPVLSGIRTGVYSSRSSTSVSFNTHSTGTARPDSKPICALRQGFTAVPTPAYTYTYPTSTPPPPTRRRRYTGTTRSSNGNCTGGRSNTGARCRSPSASGGYDCWAGSNTEKCECSEGTAWTSGTKLVHQGTTIYEYYCCTGGATLTAGTNPKQAGEKCGDYNLDAITVVVLLVITGISCFCICVCVGIDSICYCELLSPCS